MYALLNDIDCGQSVAFRLNMSPKLAFNSNKNIAPYYKEHISDSLRNIRAQTCFIKRFGFECSIFGLQPPTMIILRYGCDFEMDASFLYKCGF